MSRPKHVVNLNDVESQEFEQGEKFGLRAKRLGLAGGGERLGCTYYEVPPGRRACPYHWHAANEEALYVLEGRGRLRLDGVESQVEAGAYVACPTGDRGAHQLINDSDEPLRYVVFSTMRDPEVAGYPDSGKIAAMVGTSPGSDLADSSLRIFFREDDRAPYWDGEE